jgi:UDP-N-acetylmuramyl pentapeptide phosphotransferase/UDP-N-acetylglucosamine-1-phosphate transferase
MQYLLLTLLFFILMLLYFKVANKYNIIDKPNHRSAHTEITLRGGGIIFWFAALIYFIRNIDNSPFFFIGITIMSLISFWDDIQSLPNKIRLFAHFFAITLVFYSLNLFNILPVYGIAMAYIIFIGIINAYNFMDGINGITGLYTLVVLSSLLFINQFIQPFIDVNFILYPIVASLVFLFFNFRKKAKCFAGDVGSIAIAFWLVYLILMLIIETNSIIWILLLAVYGIDTVCTIMHRLYLKENIFEAHRHHFYQILSNDYKIQHRIVASLYAILQIIISLSLFYLKDKVNVLMLFAIIITPLLLIYLSKFYLIKRLNTK